MLELNEKLDPQFKLSRIDIEDIVNSKTILAEKESITQLPNYDEILAKKIKGQRRIEYWRNRVKLDILKNKNQSSN